VIRMRDGKMVELREYMDTALAEARLTMDAPE
jgi:ketosteroid isomerase-like protein